jgi:hypothetical protein
MKQWSVPERKMVGARPSPKFPAVFGPATCFFLMTWTMNTMPGISWGMSHAI